MALIKQNTIILASQSPRRKEILSFFHLPFEQTSPLYEEDHQEHVSDPVLYVNKTAEKKAISLKDHYPDRVILSADTLVYCNNRILTKPKNQDDAYQMLATLSNSWHSVFTGVCVVKEDKSHTQAEETRVLFHRLSPAQLRAYHNAFFYLDKAGGYAIQQAGSIIVKRIEGCFYNIMGFPINTLKELLYQVGIDLWDHLKK